MEVSEQRIVVGSSKTAYSLYGRLKEKSKKIKESKNTRKEKNNEQRFQARQK